MKHIEKYEFDGIGYNPLLIGDKWQVAKLNYLSGHGLNEINQIETHGQTDEAFILLKGTAILISANIKNDNIDFEVINMNAGIIYNLPKGLWHNIAMKTDAELIIVEDANTHLNDCKYKKLTTSQEETLREMINQIIK